MMMGDGWMMDSQREEVQQQKAKRIQQIPKFLDVLHVLHVCL
jgi:hypothetical protein